MFSVEGPNRVRELPAFHETVCYTSPLILFRGHGQNVGDILIKDGLTHFPDDNGDGVVGDEPQVPHGHVALSTRKVPKGYGELQARVKWSAPVRRPFG